jgi:hypothetical protein
MNLSSSLGWWWTGCSLVRAFWMCDASCVISKRAMQWVSLTLKEVLIFAYPWWRWSHGHIWIAIFWGSSLFHRSGKRSIKNLGTLFSHVPSAQFFLMQSYCYFMTFIYSLSCSNKLALFPSCFLLQVVLLITTLACVCSSDPSLISEPSISRQFYK